MSEEVSKVTEGVAGLEVGGDGGSGSEIYTSEARGSDECGEGSFKVPYKTILQAMRRHGKEPFPVLYQDAKPDSEAAKEGKLYDVVAKSQIKKMTKLWQQEVRKAQERVKKEEEAAKAQAERAEEAKKVKIEEDKSLPAAKRSRIMDLEPLRGQRVVVSLQANFFRSMKLSSWELKLVRYCYVFFLVGNSNKSLLYSLFRFMVGFTA